MSMIIIVVTLKTKVSETEKVDAYKYVRQYVISYGNVHKMFRYIHKRLINIRRATACLPNSSGLLERSQNLPLSPSSISNPSPPFTNSRLTAAGG